jgi:hypothetical protein
MYGLERMSRFCSLLVHGTHFLRNVYLPSWALKLLGSSILLCPLDISYELIDRIDTKSYEFALETNNIIIHGFI